jgi:hypothetical protein
MGGVACSTAPKLVESAGRRRPSEMLVIEGVIRHAVYMVNKSPGRPWLAAYEEVMRAPMDAVVKELTELLGTKLVAYLGGVKETRAVRQWAQGERSVGNPDDELRLRTALQVAKVISSRDTAAVAQAWFQGLNPQLDDRSPARLLREGDVENAGRSVLVAARSFAATG